MNSNGQFLHFPVIIPVLGHNLTEITIHVTSDSFYKKVFELLIQIL